MRERGELPSGRKVDGLGRILHRRRRHAARSAAGLAAEGLKAKIAAGAQFAQTQFCMDIEIVKRYVARLAKDRLTDQLSILIGIAPLRSGALGAMDQGAAFGAIIPDDDRRAAGICRRCGGRRQADLRRLHRAARRNPGGRGRARDGAEQRGGDPGRHCEGAQAGEESRAGILAPASEDQSCRTGKRSRPSTAARSGSCAAGRARRCLFLHGALGVSAWLPFMERLSRALRRDRAGPSGLRRVRHAGLAR